MIFDRFQKYHCVKQHDMKDCGPACLATVSKQYGLHLPISKIREAAGTDKQGTTALGLIQAAEKLGFTAKAVRAPKEALFQDFPLPAIAHVIVDQALLHYMVIHKITKDWILVADPAKGIIKYKPEEFYEIWTGILILLVPTPQFKKGNEVKGLFSRFLHLLAPQKGLLFHIFLASIIYTLFGILGAFYFKFLIDDILPYQLSKTLHILSVGIILLYLFHVLLNAFRTQLLLYLSQKLDILLILGYYHHVLSLPMNFFGTRKVGEILSRLMDASKVREAISGATLTMMIDVLMVIVGAGILYAQNAFLFGVTLLLIPFYGIIVWAFLKPYEKINHEEMEKNAHLSSYIVESLNGIETVKAYHAEREANYETEKKFVSFLKTVFKHGWIHNLEQSLKTGVELVGGVVILWVGAVQVMEGNLSVGQLVTYNALLAYFLGPIKNIINLQPMIQSAVVASERLGEILDLEVEKGEDEERKIMPSTLRGKIQFQKIEFRYGSKKPVLKNLSFTIEPGQRVALVGESGSGKTTIAKLLLHFYPVEKGEILINGYNIKDIHLGALREKIAYIPQETFFFSGSIIDNLMLGLPEKVSLERIVEVCQVTKAHDFINELPLRYNTQLEENGANLSGGQRQRLAIARALLRSPDILIMDEATSNLDSVTEKAISQTIEQMDRGITMIIIAHRLSTIMKADQIIVMSKGELIEMGDHLSLLKQKGAYYRFWQEQFPDGEAEELREIAFVRS